MKSELRNSSFFEVATTFGSVLAVNPETNSLAHVRYGQSAERIHLFVCEAWPDVGFLFSERESSIDLRIEGGGWRGRIKPVRTRPIEDGVVTLADPLTGLFLSAQPTAPRTSWGTAQLNRDEVGAWERFRLIPEIVAPASPPGIFDLMRLATEIDLTDTGVLSAFTEGSAGWDGLLALAPLISDDHYKELGRSLMRRSGTLDALAAACPDDPWAVQALPRLAGWLHADRSPSSFPMSVGVELDPIAMAGIDGLTSSFAMKLSSRLRRSVVAKRDICILATARNEGLYIVDWLAHHRAMGIEDVYLYTNDNDDGSDDLLNALCEGGAIKLIRNQVGPNALPQYKAYAHALQVLPDILDYEWVAVIDLDEYIRVDSNRFDGVMEYIGWQAAAEVDSIALNWIMCMPDQAITWSDAPLAERFPLRQLDPNCHVKSVFRPQRFSHSQCHYPYPPLEDTLRTYRTSTGVVMEPDAFNLNLPGQMAWLDHYFYKSLEEFLMRRMRNAGDGVVTRGFNADLIQSQMAELISFVFRQPKADSMQIDNGDSTAVDREREKLLDLANVKSAVATCKAAYKRDAKIIREILKNSKRFNEPGTPEREILKLMVSEENR